MKTKLLLLCLLTSLFAPMAFPKEKMPEKAKFTVKSPTLRLSASSPYSYEDAMTRFSYRKPDGYVIESIKYIKQGSLFTVLVTLRKVS